MSNFAEWIWIWIGVLVCVMVTESTSSLIQFPKFNKTTSADCPMSPDECKCYWNPDTGVFLTDCSNAGLSSIPQNISTLTTHLLLSGNKIHTLKNESFVHLANLLWLDISNSSVYIMEMQTFKGLTQLNVLSLRNNILSVKNGSYAEGVFGPLKETLKVLDLRGNLKDLPPEYKTYPDRALSCLTSLEILRIDCISDVSLPESFGNLSNLQQIDFSDGMKALSIPDNMFKYISNLKLQVLNFTGVEIGIIEGNVFSVLKSLKILDLTNNPALKKRVVGIAAALRETSIEELYLNSTCLGVTDSTEEIIKNLNGTNLKVLSLDWNEIHGLHPVFHENVAMLEVLTLRHNAMYEHFDIFMDFSKLKYLRHLDVSNQQNNADSPSLCQNQKEISVDSKAKKTQNTLAKFGKDKPKFCLEHMACPVSFPEHLEWFSASHNGVHFTQLIELVLLNNGTLKYFDVSNNGIQTILKPLYCAPNVYSVLEHADFSNNGLECVNSTFSSYCVFSMKNFNVSRNKLGLYRGGCNKEPRKDFLTFLKGFHKLETLDISSNYIDFLYNDTFAGLDLLQHIIVANNRLKTWIPDLSHMSHLEFLDLRDNNLESLPEQTQLTLSRLDKNRSNRTTNHISLNFKGNPISCTCKNLHFLTWLQSTKIVLQDTDQYFCLFSDGSRKQFHNDFSKIVTDLRTSCSDTTWFTLGCSYLVLYFVVVTIATVFFRFRHYFRYLVLRARLRRERLEAFLGIEKDYKHDAFISCTREGAKWVKKYLLDKLENQETGMKFCVAQRDFIVGKTIMDNILDCINRSRKTILLIDQTFMESNWCNEELLVSHHESLSRGYSMIICIFWPDVEVSERHLPARINALRHQVTCLKWPRDVRAREVFWLMLERALGDRKPRPGQV